MSALNEITIQGFKSFSSVERFPMRSLNVLIGANGAGKSNFISIFKMLAELVEKRLQLFVSTNDGPDALLFGSRKNATTRS